jgi:hypothetical protein
MDAQRFQAEAQAKMQVEQTVQEYQARQRQLEIEQQAQLEALKADYADRARRDQLAFEQWKATLDAEVKLTIASKPEANVSALSEQIKALADSAAEMPEIDRDEVSGEAVRVRKGSKAYGINRDAQGRAIGLMPLEETGTENG